MVFMNIYKQIFNKIKKYDTIVIARHIGPDPDALASQIALKEIILNTFPNKKVYAVGAPASKFRYIGNIDRLDELSGETLLICLDVPDTKRVDGVDISKFTYKIKIDHHPFVEKFADIELIDDTAGSTTQVLMELFFNTKLKLNQYVAERLYIGLIADTNRFMFSYTSARTFELVAKLIRETDFDFVKLYDEMYLRPIKDVRFQGYIIQNMTV